MRFLRGLVTSWRNWATNKGIRTPIHEAEAVSRFVFRSDHLRADGRAKPKAFLPEHHPATDEYELSVCRMTDCSERRAWHLGQTCRTNVNLKARADFEVRAAYEQRLTGHRAPEPNFPEHGVLVSWPPAEEHKSQRLVIAQALADASTVQRSPAE